MRNLLLAVSFATAIALLPGVSSSKGCLKGAAVGAVVGHVAGHHAVVGAAAGCVVGHHEAAVKAREAKQQASVSQDKAPHADSTGTARH
ncbi:MAG: hypothetical protein ACLQJ0_01180 [Steroidobacteraceae bacterium]